MESRLNGIEKRILTVLWDRGGTTSREVEKYLDGRKMAFSTITMALRLMVNLAYIRREKTAGKHFYYAVLTKKGYVSRIFSAIALDLFDGDIGAMILFINSVDNSVETRKKAEEQCSISLCAQK